MSADNGIFVFRDETTHYVVESTMSSMPCLIPKILEKNGDPYYRHSVLYSFTGKDAQLKAEGKAIALLREIINAQWICEYGVVLMDQKPWKEMLKEYGIVEVKDEK